jgi:L-iditol 2-dehydrogenase
VIAAKYTQGKSFEIGEVAVPLIAEDELLVRVEATSICGTDLKITQSGHRKLHPGQTIVLGHEFAGRIEQAGARVPDYPVGTRVGVVPNIGCGRCEMCGRGLANMCPEYSAFGIDRDGSHTEFVLVPAAAIAQGNVIPIPSDVSSVEAALAEPLSCVVNGIRAAGVQAGDTVLVYGAGPMGLLNMMLAQVCGASRVWVVDLSDSRLARAKTLGADAVFNPNRGMVQEWINDLTGGRGVDVVITAVPVRQVQQDAVSLLAPFGRLCLFAGLPNGERSPEINTNVIHYKNLVVTGMTGGAPRDYRTALKLIQSRRIDVRQLVSHTFPMPEVGRAYEVALSGKGLKVVLSSEKWSASDPARKTL